MATPLRKRLMWDFKRLQKDPPVGISGAPQDNSIMHWNALIFGSDDSPWDGVYADGSICLDILQNQWSPIYDVAAILTSIQYSLCYVTQTLIRQQTRRLQGCSVRTSESITGK
ncbi:unnamed protein product [Microthlaspi erraticum]|uniref:UBC core domain-containing protein n=1 Tax=Microthlaspi erraticum TaxID=1685480 RepID=A0A6D2J359_9BRAS|nr:unnamed protein product [Microthlaspi erraticum]